MGTPGGARVISADSHVTEPADLWCNGLDRRYRDQAPRVIRDFGSDRYWFTGPGLIPFAIATGFGAGKTGRDLKTHMHRGYEAARPGGWDPAQRLLDQDLDGVECEVLYPTHGMRLFALRDPALQRACFRVYNDWIAEFAAHDRGRLVPLALVSLHDIPMAVAELDRVAALGVAGALVWSAPAEGSPAYDERGYDAFWEAASSLRLPVSLHCITSGTARRPASGSSYVAYLEVVREVQRSLAELVCAGVLERFPELQLVSAENDCGWFPHFMYRLDHAHERFGRYAEHPLPMPPSVYVRRQVFATFGDDPTGPAMCGEFAADHFMWASDYPHVDSTWPHSREAIDRALVGLPPDAVRRIVGGTAATLYRMIPPTCRTDRFARHAPGQARRPDPGIHEGRMK